MVSGSIRAATVRERAIFSRNLMSAGPWLPTETILKSLRLRFAMAYGSVVLHSSTALFRGRCPRLSTVCPFRATNKNPRHRKRAVPTATAHIEHQPPVAHPSTALGTGAPGSD